MSKAEICDFCGKTILDTFSDVAYKVTKIGHAYDGYNPFRAKWSVDICPTCMKKLTQGLSTWSPRASKPPQTHTKSAPKSTNDKEEKK